MYDPVFQQPDTSALSVSRKLYPSSSTVAVPRPLQSPKFTMWFLRVVSYLAFFLTFSTFTLAYPAPAGFEPEKRTGSSNGDITDSIEAVLTTLKSVTEAVLPEIESVVEQVDVTISDIKPLLQEIGQAVNNAHVKLQAYGSVSLDSSVNVTDIASLVSGIINDIVGAITMADSTLSGLLASLTSPIDSDLAGLLSQLNGLMPTLLGLVSSLLESVGDITMGTLSSISFSLVEGLFVH